MINLIHEKQRRPRPPRRASEQADIPSGHPYHARADVPGAVRHSRPHVDRHYLTQGCGCHDSILHLHVNHRAVQRNSRRRKRIDDKSVPWGGKQGKDPACSRTDYGFQIHPCICRSIGDVPYPEACSRILLRRSRSSPAGSGLRFHKGCVPPDLLQLIQRQYDLPLLR